MNVDPFVIWSIGPLLRGQPTEVRDAIVKAFLMGRVDAVDELGEVSCDMDLHREASAKIKADLQEAS